MLRQISLLQSLPNRSTPVQIALKFNNSWLLFYRGTCQISKQSVNTNTHITVMSYWARWQSNHRRLDCLLSRLFRRRSKKTSKLRITGLCEENPPFDDIMNLVALGLFGSYVLQKEHRELLDWPQRTNCQHIEAWTKWPPHSRHFQMKFLFRLKFHWNLAPRGQFISN